MRVDIFFQKMAAGYAKFLPSQGFMLGLLPRDSV